MFNRYHYNSTVDCSISLKFGKFGTAFEHVTADRVRRYTTNVQGQRVRCARSKCPPAAKISASERKSGTPNPNRSLRVCSICTLIHYGFVIEARNDWRDIGRRSCRNAPQLPPFLVSVMGLCKVINTVDGEVSVAGNGRLLHVYAWR